MSTEGKSGAALDHLKEIGKIRIADEAILMQDLQELLAMDRAKVKAHNQRFLGGDFEEHDMGNIHIGDVNQSAPLASTPSAPSSLTRKAIAAGLLALGGGTGIGGMALYEYLTAPPVPSAESFQDTDTNTEYEMMIVPRADEQD
tara:strand:+ start:7004 stop:7435 length:432 start_codon:yes stop_codon:yes gene_type:complete